MRLCLSSRAFVFLVLLCVAAFSGASVCGKGDCDDEPDGHGIPIGRVPAGANRHDSPLLTPTLDLLSGLRPLPGDTNVHLDAGYDSADTRTELDGRGLLGQIAHRGEKVSIQASQRWHIERTHACQQAFHRLARCYERRTTVINSFFDLADTIITVRSLIRRAWTTHRWDARLRHRP